MPGKFLSFQQTAARLIREKGTTALLKRPVTSALDPVTQARTDATQSWTFDVVVLAPTMAKRFGVDLEGKDAREVYFALEGQAVTPEPGDVLVLDGKDWPLFWAQTHDPALDGPVMTMAYVERGS